MASPFKFPDPPYSESWSIPASSSGAPSTSSEPHIPGQAIPLSAKSPKPVQRFLHHELNVDRLNDLHRGLWICGRRGNIHPLHWHKMMRRDILITEDPSLHLVWLGDRIFIKPIPECLFHRGFFRDWVCTDKEAYANACGLLATYTKLIIHQSDFNIAKELGFLPPSFDWMTWCQLSQQLTNTRMTLNKRYEYGELRMSRLNILTCLFRRGTVYHAIDRSYASWFSSNFTWLLFVFAYFSIITSALQLLVAVDTTAWVTSASKWIAGLVLAGIALGVIIQVLLFSVLFPWNWGKARKPVKRRSYNYDD